MTSFSKRYGYGANVVPAPISVREDAPHDFRGVLVDLAYESLAKPSVVREIVCRVLRVRADSNNWSEFPNIDREVRELLDDAPWYKVYDVAEAIYSALVHKHRHDAAADFSRELNAYFVEHGIGWELHQGELRYRGPEGFEAVVKSAHAAVTRHNHRTAASELHEALNDLSRRPHPDRTGAVQHAMASLECVARDVCGSTTTLGDVIKANRDLMPRPLDVAVEKIWGFTSERGRHLVEGREPTEQEAELIVGLAAALGAYLAKLRP
ncbi:AbiJ-NTD4 domain-containing protein [Cupriavidus sp. IK-TO18]|uniref:AbiJ-NTD4 domain-containing protein n=1 Tax=Cupriavidus sp. IK-TO18 TaxID=2782182 RepID=UPI0018981487|nr:hypothetical protein [Cupriavidus sp. IK-TO18]MBF6989300.1 hypothetical protein [Cupriavidus sp. IK-TO18]